MYEINNEAASIIIWHDNGFNTFHFICILLYHMHTAIVYICVLFAENEMKIVKGVALCMLLGGLC